MRVVQEEQAALEADPAAARQRAFFELLAQGDAADAEELLLEHGLDVDARETLDGPTALHAAAARDDAPAVAMLLRHGADTGLKYGGMTPADVARATGASALADLLA
jgi:ankyrin repeat protein